MEPAEGEHTGKAQRTVAVAAWLVGHNEGDDRQELAQNIAQTQLVLHRIKQDL